MNLRNTRFALGLVLTLFMNLADAGSADFTGPVSYQVSGSSVRVTADRISNSTTNRITGTLHLTLRMTSGPDVTGSGYTVARQSLSYVGTDTGRLAPESSFVNISFNTAFSAPPAGSYYVHLYVSETPNTETILDHVTFTSLASIGGGGGGGGTGGDGNDTMGSATPIAVNTSTSGAISSEGELDYYRFSVSSSGTLTAGTSSNMDTIGTLYNASGTEIATNDDYDGARDFRLSATLTAGTYYLMVRGYSAATGAYSLATTFTGTGGGGGGGGGGAGTASTGVELVGTSNWVTDSSDGTVTMFQDQIRNSRATPTGQLSLLLRAYDNLGDTSGYTLARYDIGVLSAGAAFSNVSATVDYDAPPSGSYYVAYELIEETSTGTFQVDRVDFDGQTDFGGGGGGGAVSPFMLLGLAALAGLRRRSGRFGARKEVTHS